MAENEIPAEETPQAQPSTNYTAGNIFLRSIAIRFSEKRGGSTHWQVRQSSVANITYLQVDTSYIPFLSQLGHLMNIMSFQQQPR